jgi:hypothetical protein
MMANYKVTYDYPGGSGTTIVPAQSEHEAVTKFNRDFTKGINGSKKIITRVEKVGN